VAQVLLPTPPSGSNSVPQCQNQRYQSSGYVFLIHSPYPQPEFTYAEEGKEGISKEKKDQNEKIWELMSAYLKHDIWAIQKHILNHVEYTFAKSRFTFEK